MKRDGFIFYRSLKEALKKCPDDVRLEVYDAIGDYMFTGEIPSDLSLSSKIVFTLIEPHVEAIKKRLFDGKNNNRKERLL